MPDLHRFQKRYEKVIQSLEKTSIHHEEKDSIMQFLRDMRAKGIGLPRLIKLCYVLTLLNTKLGKPLHKAREEGIKQLVHHYETGPYSFWRRHDVKCIIKQYFGWLNGGKYPKKVEWICTTIPRKDVPIVYEGELLTVEEVNRIIDSADHPRNKALLSVLSESGARIGEIGNLEIGQVHVDPNGVVINVNGKTGHRRIRLVASTPHLVAWLNSHPMKNDPRALVWINYGPKGYHQPMSYEAVRKIIQLAFEHANVKKQCYPYIFRHTRACQLAHHLTEYQMCAYFGWVYGSEMPRYYIRISGRDLDEPIMRMNGLKPGETPIYTKPQERICPRCKNINSATALYCGKCAEIVDPVLALKIQMEQVEKPVERVKTPFLEWMQKDPELREVLKRKATEYREVANNL